jgi:hypothetical protein
MGQGAGKNDSSTEVAGKYARAPRLRASSRSRMRRGEKRSASVPHAGANSAGPSRRK